VDLQKGQPIHSDKEAKSKPVDEIVVIDFDPVKREKPFPSISRKTGNRRPRQLADLHSSWLPDGMDIYEMGAYSAPDKAGEAELFPKIRGAVSLEWAQRVKPGAAESELKPAKSGVMTPCILTHGGLPKRLEVRWRQWVFMVGNTCYFIVSTIFPKGEGNFSGRGSHAEIV